MHFPLQIEVLLTCLAVLRSHLLDLSELLGHLCQEKEECVFPVHFQSYFLGILPKFAMFVKYGILSSKSLLLLESVIIVLTRKLR